MYIITHNHIKYLSGLNLQQKNNNSYLHIVIVDNINKIIKVFCGNELFTCCF